MNNTFIKHITAGAGLLALVIIPFITPLSAEEKALKRKGAKDRAVEKKESATFILNPDELIPAGKKLLESGEHIQALTLFERALLVSPGSIDALFFGGKIHIEHLLPEDGIKMMLECHKLEPKRPEVNLLLGEAYLESGEFKKAVESFNEERRVSGDSPRLCYNLAIAYMFLKDWESARTELKKVSTPDLSGSAHFNLGLIAITQGDTGTGLSELGQAVENETDPEQKNVFNAYLDKITKNKQSPEDFAKNILLQRELILFSYTP